MSDTIDSEARFREALTRAAALRDHRTAIRAVQALASANRDAGAIGPEDMRDLAALDDVIADIGYTLRCIDTALADWESAQNHGAREDVAADRAWHRRRTL